MDLDRIHSNSHDVVRSDSVLSAAAVVEIETGAGETIYIYSSDKIPHSSFLERTNESIHSSTAFLDGTNQPTCTYVRLLRERPFFNKAFSLPFPSRHVTSLTCSLARSLRLNLFDPARCPLPPSSSSSVQLCIYTLERTSSPFPPTPNPFT